MIVAIARSRSGSVHTLTGTVEGGVPNKQPGQSVPFRSITHAIDSLSRNGWEVIEVTDDDDNASISRYRAFDHKEKTDAESDG